MRLVSGKNLVGLSIFCLLFFFSQGARASSLEKAELLSSHGLVDDARKELIDVIFEKQSAKEAAAAYYALGNLAFREDNVAVALETWTTLVEQYPSSNEAKVVSQRLGELAEIVGEAVEETTENAVAASYLRHGDFWSDGKDRVFSIDSSWIPNVESAIKWYDKTISEFPNTTASRLAYQAKLRTLLGWTESGRYGSKHGVDADPLKYIPQLVSTFSAYEQEHPSASALQAFRYQIAQAYWSTKNWDETRAWLTKIIEAGRGQDSFYSDLAERRMEKIEY